MMTNLFCMIDAGTLTNIMIFFFGVIFSLIAYIHHKDLKDIKDDVSEIKSGVKVDHDKLIALETKQTTLETNHTDCKSERTDIQNRLTNMQGGV